ncbi:MAG: hypothetical protein KatS3mg114_0446 [Planctomycetaceae bacterium]|nr:MAG: hypothetical protein KatS3mg114_0446 [Planctomycetaceae bacterium]
MNYHLNQKQQDASHPDLLEIISSFAERAYPKHLVCDEKLWEDTINNREVCLPLSSEEYRRLEELCSENTLPVIIEGRAGSGKSTILVYYTCECLLQEISNHSCRLLFVTQSASLLERERANVTQLLHQRRRECGAHNGSLQADFYTFHEFALSQLPPEVCQRYRRRSYYEGWIGFERFRDLLRGATSDGLRDPNGQKLNPEAVWFTIRSYIKGFRIHHLDENRWMTPEDYACGDEVPREDRQVSTELYAKIWNSVWSWYKRLTIPCEENDWHPLYWDDLDLAWEMMLHRSPDAPDYAVIVCDEVQDLTRVELAAMLKTLTWTQYDVTKWGELHVPVVLVGDAHQTVNPACFRWARVRTDVAATLIRHLPNANIPDVRFIELKFNYRNAPAIATLCNSVQHLRQQA